MKHFSHYLISTIIFYLFVGIIYGQQYILKGKVINQTKQPIELIQISLLKNDQQVVVQTVTDSLGFFSLSADDGRYLINGDLFQSELFRKEIILNQDTDIGVIQINDAVQLEGVTLAGKKKLIEKKIDRLIFNVENSTSITGGNALDALRITPRLKVQNGQISMIGKNGMMVMVNDRLLSLSGEDLANFLKTLNAEDLKRIEVITNPPAKYVAAGNSGIINIVTKSSKKDAWNASLRSTYQQASYATGNIGGSFNLQKNKFDLTSNISYSNGSNAPDASSTIYYPSTIWDIQNKRRSYSDNLSARFGLTYKLNDKIKTGFSINHVSSNPLTKEKERTNIYNTGLSRQLDSIITTKGRNEYEKKLTSFNYNIVYEIDTVGKKMSIDVDFFDYRNSTNRFFNTQSFFNNNIPKPNGNIQARNYGLQDIQNYSINLDMEHPTKWINLNYGARISKIKTNNLFEYFDIEDNKEILDISQSNAFDYQENIQAVYLSGQKKFNDKWEAKFGLRYEWTQTKGFSKTVNQVNDNNYRKLFPTLYLSYTLNEDHVFNLNYGRRIQRPSYNFLNPFRFVSNPFSYSEGNPFLQPSFTDNIELEYSFKDNLITNFYFSYIDDDFEQVTFLDSNTNIQQIIPKNFIINRTVGLNQTAIFKPAKWWNVNLSANVYYSSTDSKIPQTLQFLSGWNGEFSASNDFTLNESKTVLANINYYYTTKGVDNLDYNSSANQLNASIKWLLLNKKMIISLNVNDIFSSNRFRYTTFSNNIKNSFTNYSDDRFFRLGIIYNFGKKIQTDNRESKNKEEQDRTN
ncbi:TonB-dependent receptor [Elizabethkingia anophelis]|nr:TonB-dependent receptor [Elizabethkingia anophelis]